MSSDIDDTAVTDVEGATDWLVVGRMPTGAKVTLKIRLRAGIWQYKVWLDKQPEPRRWKTSSTPMVTTSGPRMRL